MDDKNLEQPETAKTIDELKYEAAAKKQRKKKKEEERRCKFNNKTKKLKRKHREVVTVDFKRGTIVTIIPSNNGDSDD